MADANSPRHSTRTTHIHLECLLANRGDDSPNKKNALSCFRARWTCSFCVRDCPAFQRLQASHSSIAEAQIASLASCQHHLYGQIYLRWCCIDLSNAPHVRLLPGCPSTRSNRDSLPASHLAVTNGASFLKLVSGAKRLILLTACFDALVFAALMLPRRIEVFFYGLFIDVDLPHTKGVEPTKIRPACAPGFALRIGRRATLLWNPDARAYGMLMQLTHDEIEQLYSEASVLAYRPEAVLCGFRDGSRVPALCFNLVAPPGPEEANSEYSAKLRDPARPVGFRSDYVERIQ